MTIEVESEDSEWEGKLIVLKNDREIEEDTVRGRSDEETYDVSVEAGDVITAYIENDVSDCFDTLVFTGGESVGRDNGGSSGGGSGSDVECSHPFVDVPRNIWYENLMCTLYNWRDVIRGKTPTVAAPADAMTRAEFATVLLRMYELEELPFTKNYFNDVQSGAWYYEEMNVAVEQGLMEVPYNKLGRPNSPATRAEMLVMWARLNNVATSHRLSGTGLCPDMNDSHFAAYAFAYASELELDVDVSGKSTVITGDDATGKCRPDDRANRAEASAIALRGYIATEGSDDIDADLLNLLD